MQFLKYEVNVLSTLQVYALQTNQITLICHTSSGPYVSYCNNGSCVAEIIKFSSIIIDISANDSCVAIMIKLPSIGKFISVNDSELSIIGKGMSVNFSNLGP